MLGSFSTLSRGLLSYISKLYHATMQNCSVPNDLFAGGGSSKDWASRSVLRFLDPGLYQRPTAIINQHCRHWQHYWWEKESFLNKPCCVIKGTILNMRGLNVEKEMFQLVWEEESSYFLMLLVSKAPPDAQAAQLHQGQRPWRKSQGRGYTRGFLTPKP